MTNIELEYNVRNRWVVVKKKKEKYANLFRPATHREEPHFVMASRGEESNESVKSRVHVANGL